MGSIESCLLANPACPAADGVTTRETDAVVLEAAKGAITFLPAKSVGAKMEKYQNDMIARQVNVTSADQILSWAV